MTKAEVLQTIKDTIRMNGFTPTMNERYSPLPYIQQGDHYAAVNIRAQIDFDRCDWKNGIKAFRVKASASICRMGGEPTPQDLLTAADEIRRAAELVKELQSMELAYTEQ